MSELVLEAPLSGATVGVTVEIRGRISAMPFEKNLTYRIYNQAGIVVDQSWISVEWRLRRARHLHQVDRHPRHEPRPAPSASKSETKAWSTAH